MALGKSLVFRIVPVLLATGLAMWAVVPMTIATTLGRRDPAAAQWWPQSELALVSRAERELMAATRGPRNTGLIRESALAALNRAPVSAAAARLLAMAAVMEGDQAKGRRLFAYSESLSRRDLPTQLWLIEDNVQRNDIDGALRHYDRALRTSNEASGLLIPILVSAAADSRIAPPLARLVAGRPSWWLAFAEKLGREGNSPAAIAGIGGALRLTPNRPEDRAIIEIMINRLVQLRAYPEALAFYRRASGAPNSGAPVRDGGFEQDGSLGPFEWTLTQEAGLAAVREAGRGGRPGNVLAIETSNERSGVVARQLLLLPPGDYRLQAVAGDVPGAMQEAPSFALRCAIDGAPELTRLPVSEVGVTGRPFSWTFRIPPACAAQWLTIQSGTKSDLTPTNVISWIDEVTIAPLQAPRG